jgi:arylformamidase
MRVERDLAYGDDPRQRLDAYFPARPPGGALLVMVHGGAWAMGDKAGPAVVDAKVAHWLPVGVIVVSVNYRLLPQAEPIEQARDLARSLAFVQSHAASWGADAQRVVLMGHSTGAHLAALLLADEALARGEGVQPWLATVLLDSAALDVVHLMRGPHLRLHDRAFGAAPERWEQVSPLHRLRAAPRPIALVHSTERPGSGEQARRFANAVQALGGRADVMPVELAHAEVNARLGEASPYTASVDAFLRSVGWP